MVFALDKKLWFPNPRLAEDDGCLAVGGDLCTDRLLLAYQNGIFPWYSFREGDIYWYCPKQRFVLFPSEVHISHSMRTLMNKQQYRLSINEDFPAVISACSQLRIHEKYAWLGPDMVEAYTELHRQGFAASVEVWSKGQTEKPEASAGSGAPRASATSGQLVGGLYGVNIGRCFFGESMFSLVPSASKLALIHLARYMQEHGGRMIDCQFETPHLRSMGGRFISYDNYMSIVNEV